MVISYYGLGCFKLQTKDFSLVVDPYPFKKYNLKSKLRGDIFLLNSEVGEEFKKEGFLISSPGEYEIKNCFIKNLFFFDKGKKLKIISKIELNDFKIVHLDKLNSSLPDELMGEISSVDILMVPVGGKEVLTSNKAIELISQIEPKIILPTYYRIPQLKLPFSPLDNFLKEIAIKKEFLEKLKVNKKDLEKGSKVVILRCLI